MNMNRITIVLGGVSLVLAGVLVGTQVLAANGAGSPVLAAQTPPVTATAQNRTITVVGQGKTTSKPDIATLNLGVEVRAATVTEATAQSKEKMDAISKALSAAGIADKDIQTSNYNIHQEQQTPGGPVPAKGIASNSAAPGTPGETVYVVNNMVSVKVHNLDKVGTVLDQVVAAGANNVWGVAFGIENDAQVQADARAKAIDDARGRAQDLAKLSGVTLGSVLSVSEAIGNSPAYPMMGDKGGGAGQSIAAGELDYIMNVQVTFSIQ